MTKHPATSRTSLISPSEAPGNKFQLPSHKELALLPSLQLPPKKSKKGSAAFFLVTGYWPPVIVLASLFRSVSLSIRAPSPPLTARATRFAHFPNFPEGRAGNKSQLPAYKGLSALRGRH